MSLFQAYKRLIQMGAIFGVAPYRLKDHYFETSTLGVVMSITISFINLFTITRIILYIIFSPQSYEAKPFGYALLFDGVFFLSYSSGCFIVGGVLFSRKKLISHMNRLCSHPIMRNTYQYEQKIIRNFSIVIYVVLFSMASNLLSGTMADAHFVNYYDVILSVPLLCACAMVLVQFLVAVQVIYLSYGRIQHELRAERLTVDKLQQCCLLDIWLKDYGSVVEIAYGPFNAVYIGLSFLYVLTIELYIAEGGPTFKKAIISYVTVLPALILFVWFIWKCTLITHETENTLQCLHDVTVDIEDPNLREAMVGAVTSYVVTLVQFQAAFYT